MNTVNQLKTIKSNMRKAKVTAASLFGGGLGMILSFSLIALVELTDKRIRTTDDITRVTRLPVLTTLGDLRTMDDAARILGIDVSTLWRKRKRYEGGDES